ncbi:She3 protein [Saccharomycopsis crataegensis]|uniref:SWI5-dependent HO expression protein 3 n=1 Tax=Saccharomycopsis crataegensis TaxID=43959 RepID=A0AAV5QTJ1_9ASCO|nr:She3 protein [Saccharomycopsis crataegensis]
MNFTSKESGEPYYSKAGYDSKANYEALMKSPSEILSPTNSTFGSPKPGTSRVIDSLHQNIDSLKNELQEVKSKHEDDKNKHVSIKKRYDQVVEQLATQKHENDMVNALLERKQRRITDLEEKLGESMNSQEDYKFNLTNLEVRCKKLQESERVATSEFERMKIAYETVVTSQKEYRDYYTKEINSLKDSLASYVAERTEALAETKQQIISSDSDISSSMKQLTEQSRSLENQYAAKNSAVIDTLKSLAVAAKSHGSDTQLIINQCNLVFNELKNRFDLDVTQLIENYKDREVDNTIEKLLGIDSTSSSAVVPSSPQPHQTSNKSTPSPGATLPKKRGSVRKPSATTTTPSPRNVSNGSAKEQENIDPKSRKSDNNGDAKKKEPKKNDRRSLSGAGSSSNGPSITASPSLNSIAAFSPNPNGNNNKRHSRKASLTKGADFGDFEKKSVNKSKRNSLANDLMNQDWRGSSPSAPGTPKLNNSFNEEDEKDEVDDEVADGDAGKKKRKRKRNRKRKSMKPENDPSAADTELDDINNMIKNDLNLTTSNE